MQLVGHTTSYDWKACMHGAAHLVLDVDPVDRGGLPKRPKLRRGRPEYVLFSRAPAAGSNMAAPTASTVCADRQPTTFSTSTIDI